MAGPHYTFSPAIFAIRHIKRSRRSITIGPSSRGRSSRCGCLQDWFGVTWLTVLSMLGDLLQSVDETKAAAVMQAM